MGFFNGNEFKDRKLERFSLLMMVKQRFARILYGIPFVTFRYGIFHSHCLFKYKFDKDFLLIDGQVFVNGSLNVVN